MTDSPSYAASPIKRNRRTNARLAQLDDQILEILGEDHPQSIRHVYYRLTNPRLLEPVPKTDQGYDQVQARLTKLRRAGVIRYDWIADMSRRGYFTDTFRGADDFIRNVAGLYRADLWRNAGCYCEVWCESRSIASVILNDCRELAVSLYPCGGFVSISFAKEAVQDILRRFQLHDETGDIVTGQPIKIFYVGDYDPAGVLIDVALERELRLHLPKNVDLSFVRIGITPEQVAVYDLPKKDRKEKDKRAPEVKWTVEAEALPANILRKILRDAVESLLPPDALHVAKVAEQAERVKLFDLARTIQRGTRQ